MFIANISSMLAGAVVGSLCTLELTITRQFCSIFEHEKFMALTLFPAALGLPREVDVQEREPERGFSKRNVAI